MHAGAAKRRAIRCLCSDVHGHAAGRLRWLKVCLAALVLAVSIGGSGQALAGAGCTFRFGFASLHAALPDVVGDCLADESHESATGDALQPTLRGLLVWRKADNWTAFTDGYRTWVNGPLGLQTRLNAERFAWEAGDQVVQVQVFFGHGPESLDDLAAVVPVVRSVRPVGRQVATAALEALIAGPTPEEQATGFFSELGGMLAGDSSCGGPDFRLTIGVDGLATVRLCRQTSSAGVGQDARVMAELEATLRQFPSIQRVRVLTRDGNCLFDLSGLNRCLETNHQASVADFGLTWLQATA